MRADDPAHGRARPMHRQPVGRRFARFADRGASPKPAMNDDGVRASPDDLGQALSHGGLSLFYQPIVDLATGATAGFEVFPHWFHAMEGHLGPQRVLSMAERAGLADRLTMSVLAMAARTAARWSGYGFVALGVPIEQAGRLDFASTSERVLHGTGLSPRRLMIALWNSSHSGDPRQVETTVARLRETGVAIALDHAGQGDPDPAVLRSAGFDALRLRPTLPRSTRDRSNDHRRAVPRIGHAKGPAIVACGLQTADQVRAASAAGCTHGQGDAIGVGLPMPVNGTVPRG